jgi:hypothetical protein
VAVAVQPTGRAVTAQGHPRAIFKRAVERGNIVGAETTARELGRLTLEEALTLVILYAEKEPIKYERSAGSPGTSPKGRPSLS